MNCSYSCLVPIVPCFFVKSVCFLLFPIFLTAPCQKKISPTIAPPHHHGACKNAKASHKPRRREGPQRCKRVVVGVVAATLIGTAFSVASLLAAAMQPPLAPSPNSAGIPVAQDSSATESTSACASPTFFTPKKWCTLFELFNTPSPQLVHTVGILEIAHNIIWCKRRHNFTGKRKELAVAVAVAARRAVEIVDSGL